MKADSTSEYIKKNAQMIEKTLDSFGIRTRVVEVLDNKNDVQYSLEIVMGTKLDDVLALNHDLALALAAPGGKVEIQAPIPGRSLVGITVLKRKNEIKDTPVEKYKIIKVFVKPEENDESDAMESLRAFIAVLLTFFANGIVSLANKIDRNANISWQEYSHKQKKEL